MTSALLTVLVLTAATQGASLLPEAKSELVSLRLELVLEKPAIVGGSGPAITARVANLGSTPVVLILPGDGSDLADRTPILKWYCTRTTPSGVEDCARRSLGACGLLNPLELTELFTLDPGATKELGPWASLPRFRKAGTYRVTLEYENNPRLQLRVPCEESTKAQVEASTPCHLLSNELVFEVTQ